MIMENEEDRILDREVIIFKQSNSFRMQKARCSDLAGSDWNSRAIYLMYYSLLSFSTMSGQLVQL